MENNISDQLDLIEKSNILLLVEHQENKKILNQYLNKFYDVSNFQNQSLNKVSFDMLIVDEQGFKKKHQFIEEIKNSNSSFYLPVILISKSDIKNMENNYLKLVDEVVNIPISKKILKSRIDNLLNIRKLFLSTSIFQKLTEENPVGICILNEDKIKYLNKSFLEIIENKKTEVMGKSIFEIFSEDELKASIMEENLPSDDFITLELQKESEKKWVNLKIKEINYENTNFKLLIMMDITEQRKSEEQIQFLSFHDKLTDLYNRNYFMEELKRLNTERKLPLTIIMGDVNSLKIVNDAFGHKKGDQLLKKVAEILKNNIRDADILARIGGDEFSILLPRTDKETALKICQRIKKICFEKK